MAVAAPVVTPSDTLDVGTVPAGSPVEVDPAVVVSFQRRRSDAVPR